MTQRPLGAAMAVVALAVLAACGTYAFPTETIGADVTTSTAEPVTRAEVDGRYLIAGHPGGFVDLDADGTVGGYDGCNGFSIDRWELRDARVEISGEAVTGLKGCAPDASAPVLRTKRIEPLGEDRWVARDEDGRRLAELLATD